MAKWKLLKKAIASYSKGKKKWKWKRKKQFQYKNVNDENMWSYRPFRPDRTFEKQEYSIKHLNRICISFEHVVNTLIHMKIEILQIKTAEAKWVNNSLLNEREFIAEPKFNRT